MLTYHHSKVLCGIPLRAISQKMLKDFILEMSLKITNLRLQLHLPGANELNWAGIPYNNECILRKTSHKLVYKTNV